MLEFRMQGSTVNTLRI